MRRAPGTRSHRGVMLGERPYLMATVPVGELVPTEGPLISSDGTRTVLSPDGQVRATVATSTRGSVALELFEAGQSDPFLSVPTGLAQIQMAWSPDSTRLAYVSSMAGQNGIVWRLRMVDVASRSGRTGRGHARPAPAFGGVAAGYSGLLAFDADCRRSCSAASARWHGSQIRKGTGKPSGPSITSTWRNGSA